MVAVPILARAGEVIGVVVLHTEAPREFDEDVLNFLVHTASLVAGAIENAQLYEEARRRVDALTTLDPAQPFARGGDLREDLYDAVTRGARQLLGADACQIWRLDPRPTSWRWRGRTRRTRRASAAPGRAALLLDLCAASRARDAPASARRTTTALLVAPLVAGDEQLGILRCVVRGRALPRRRRGAPPRCGQPDRGRAEEGRADRAADRREHRQGHVRGARRGRGRDRPRPRRATRAATSAARTCSSTPSAPRAGRTARRGPSLPRACRRGCAALPARLLRRPPRRPARAGPAADATTPRRPSAVARVRRAGPRGGLTSG